MYEDNSKEDIYAFNDGGRHNISGLIEMFIHKLKLDQDDIIIAPLFAVKRRLTSNKIPNLVFMIMLRATSEQVLNRVQKRIEVLLQERHQLASYQQNDFEIMNLKEISGCEIAILFTIAATEFPSVTSFLRNLSLAGTL